jgi:hypothetical protein
VRREMEAFECSGQPRVLPLASVLAAVPSVPQQPGVPTPQPGSRRPNPGATVPDVAAAFPPVPDPGVEKPGDPKTVVEMARRANEQSSDQVKKTGEQVGGAVQKTWTCVTSLFQRC